MGYRYLYYFAQEKHHFRNHRDRTTIYANFIILLFYNKDPITVTMGVLKFCLHQSPPWSNYHYVLHHVFSNLAHYFQIICYYQHFSLHNRFVYICVCHRTFGSTHSLFSQNVSSTPSTSRCDSQNVSRYGQSTKYPLRVNINPN